jgi:hypothetical protein
MSQAQEAIKPKLDALSYDLLFYQDILRSESVSLHIPGKDATISKQREKTNLTRCLKYFWVVEGC